MKKIFLLLFVCINFVLGADLLPGYLSNYTPMFAMRSLDTGVSLSPLRNTSSKLEDQNWILREIVLDDELKQKDPLSKKLPFGYVQFVNPSNDDLCLAATSGSFKLKSCSNDLEFKHLETVFSIIPTTTSAVQIRSVAMDGTKCIVSLNSSAPLDERFGLEPCIFDTGASLGLRQLMFFTPAIVEATPLY
ncbi:TPA: cytolethal distending toxin subunit A [Campylobacter lari]|nr:cytolethal distending toxin subunit A [Campylobacter lari]